MCNKHTWSPSRRSLNARREARAAALWITIGAAVFSVGGCPFVPTDPNTPGFDDKSNNTFATAAVIALGDDDEIVFTATIGNADDVDVFDLGELAPGDQVFVDVQTTSGNLDPVAAIFDEREYLYAFSDDRNPDASNLNPLIDVQIRGPQGPYFLGVASFPSGGSTGEYRVIVRVTRDLTLLDPEPQIVYLNWAGGQNIRIENVGVYDLDPFSAADVGLPANRTAELKDAIQGVIADRFDGFALMLENTDDDPAPTLPHSTVHFGGDSRNAFAIAEQIDTFNEDQSDNAIVFTDGFRGAFSITPTLNQMATAIGNTAAHEVGHLLGLIHTDDCAGLMDTACGNDALLFEQAFKLSPIDESVFPIGLQNAQDLIEWTIGVLGI